MILLSVLLGLAAIALLLPSFSEALSLVRWPFIHRPQSRSGVDAKPSLLFLVLAHNEELVLAPCLRSLTHQTYPADLRYVIVVADNCTDRTSEIARNAEVRVLERSDEHNRGKPHAIAWTLNQIKLAQFDAVVIVDADTQVSADFAQMLAARGPLVGKVLQPFIGVQNPDENALTRMAAVHATAAHGLAYRIKEAVGLNVPLGVGMCIGRDVLLAEPWSAFSLSEDWELYAIFTARGVAIEPVGDARIYAQEARSLKQSAPQRHRWMTGKLDVLRRHTLPLLKSPEINWWQRLDAIAELAALGPAVHLGFAVAGALAASLGPSAGAGGTLVAWMFLVSLVRPTIYTALAIIRDPLPLRAFSAFFFLPFYTVWRLWSALLSLTGSSRGAWVRTARHIAPTDDH